MIPQVRDSNTDLYKPQVAMRLVSKYLRSSSLTKQLRNTAKMGDRPALAGSYNNKRLG